MSGSTRADIAVVVLLVVLATLTRAEAQAPQYTFVDHLSSPAPPVTPASAAASAVRNALTTTATFERDVRVLAAQEMRGRLRGTDDNAPMS